MPCSLHEQTRIFIKKRNDHFRTLVWYGCLVLSPGQTERQVVASGDKLNLRRDLRWVAKRTSKFPHKYMRVAKKKKPFKADIPCISLAK